MPEYVFAVRLDREELRYGDLEQVWRNKGTRPGEQLTARPLKDGAGVPLCGGAWRARFHSRQRHSTCS
jgi:hypothetical protein